MEIQQRSSIHMVRLNGADLTDPLTLHNKFEEVIIHEGARKLLVDLSDVSYMNSMQIGAVVGLHVLAYENLAEGLGSVYLGCFKAPRGGS